MEDSTLQANIMPFPGGKNGSDGKKTLKSRNITSEKSSIQEKCQQGGSSKGWGVSHMRSEEMLDFITSYAA